MSDVKPVDEAFQGVYSAEKYQSKNPLARWLVQNFMSTVLDLAKKTGATGVHEVGCGEGQLCGMFRRAGLATRGCDISESSLSVAEREAARAGLDIAFRRASVYELDSQGDTEELIVCCEVLEHLEEPERALSVLSELARPYLIVSVPREPLWRMLNVARGKYLADFGNTPDHVQHWSTGQFVRLVEKYIQVIEVRTPLPWTVLLCKRKTANKELAVVPI